MSYAKFYGLLSHMPGGNSDELKEQLVWQYTNKRTTSLHEMTEEEYERMCRELSRRSSSQEELRQCRSKALHQMQLLGVNTADWNAVNAYCQDVRIAGKAFYYLSVEELESLTRKLRAIRQKMRR